MGVGMGIWGLSAVRAKTGAISGMLFQQRQV